MVFKSRRGKSPDNKIKNREKYIKDYESWFQEIDLKCRLKKQTQMSQKLDNDKEKKFVSVLLLV